MINIFKRLGSFISWVFDEVSPERMFFIATLLAIVGMVLVAIGLATSNKMLGRIGIGFMFPFGFLNAILAFVVIPCLMWDNYRKTGSIWPR